MGDEAKLPSHLLPLRPYDLWLEGLLPEYKKKAWRNGSPGSEKETEKENKKDLKHHDEEVAGVSRKQIEEAVSMAKERNRPIRIAGASGSASDRRHAMATFAKAYPTDPVDVIVSDYMSEANMVTVSSPYLSVAVFRLAGGYKWWMVVMVCA